MSMHASLFSSGLLGRGPLLPAALLLTAFLTLLLSGCNDSPSSGAAGTSSAQGAADADIPRVGLLLYSTEDPYISSVGQNSGSILRARPNLWRTVPTTIK